MANTAVKRLSKCEFEFESPTKAGKLRTSMHIPSRVQKAPEKSKQNYEGVNSGKLSFNTRKILRSSLPCRFIRFLNFDVFVLSTLLSFVNNPPIFFPRFSIISRMRVTFDGGVHTM